MRILLAFCCLFLSITTMASSVELTIYNASSVDFDVFYKGRDTKIDPPIGDIDSGKTVTTTLTKKDGYPVVTFLLNPDDQRIGITVAPDARLIVTSCPFCKPTETTCIKDGKAAVTINLERN